MDSRFDMSDEMAKAKAGEVEDAHAHSDNQHYNTHLTRRILLKTDTRILPILALLFLCSFLDRTNVGNAKIIGLTEDLNMTNLQYNQGLAVFYATYIARYHLYHRKDQTNTEENQNIHANDLLVNFPPTSFSNASPHASGSPSSPAPGAS